MTNGPVEAVLRHLRKAAGVRPAEDLSDGHLLERFASGREETAFEALVQRHGRLVLGVCRRVLRHPEDVEDAFQATFLLLARKAASIRKAESVGCWLYGVAFRVAARARADARRREAHENQTASRWMPDPLADVLGREVRAVLDEELSRLPKKYRAPLVLCYLEGKTQGEAAQVLGCPPGSMSRWLDRGKAILRSRLARRGITGAGLALPALAGTAAEGAVPAALAAGAVHAAVRLTTVPLASAGGISARNPGSPGT